MHHVPRLRLGQVRVVADEFDQGGPIGEAHFIRAAGEALHCTDRAVADIHRDIHAFLIEIALALGEQKGAC